MNNRIWMMVAALAGVAMLARAETESGYQGYMVEDDWGFACGTPHVEAAMERESEAKAVARAATENGTVVEPEWRKKGLVLRYGFGKGGEWGPGAKVEDLSGEGHDGTVEGDGLEVVRGIGKRGKAVRFDGKGDYIRVPRDKALEGDEITVAAWVKVREGAASCGEDGIGAVVFKRNTSFHDNEDYCLEIHPGRLLRTDLSSPRGGHAKVTTREALAPELWHHVAVAVGDGMARIYVDGVLAAEQVHVQPFDHSRTTDLFVGARDHAGHPMDRFGAFDLAELAIWNEALGAERVAALYRERAGHYGVAKPEDNRMAAEARRVAFSPPKDLPRSGGPVLHYAFGRGRAWAPGAVVRDLSGGGHDGRVEGDGLEVVAGMGRRLGAARFDGNGDYIRVPRSAAFEGQDVSVAAWVRVKEGAQWENGATIAFKRNASSSHNEGYHLEIFPDRTVRAVASGPNAVQCRVQSTVPLTDEEWHHVAMVHAPGDTRLYIDGVLEGRGAYPNEVEHNAEADLLIGGRDHALYPVDLFAKFDVAEVTVWTRALGDGEMAGLYREKAGCPGVGRSGSAGTALVESGAERKLSWRGIEQPPRKFPAWEPGAGKDGGTGTEAEWVRELRELVAQGRRDRAASPEF
ncbi:MAG: LamG domain-containing protein, partial [Kiritimatiellae bacterium]|nr:LamG domain-containing protein [Kiritimatiellia bacterium]